MLIQNLQRYANYITPLLANSIMPDHIHLLVEAKDEQQLAVFLKNFKKRTSREITQRLDDLRPPVWQPGTYDHWIRPSHDNADLRRHVSYLYGNSMKHLGIPPAQYVYHNYSEAVARGWIEE